MIKDQATHPFDIDSRVKLLLDTAVHHSIIIQGKKIQLHPGSLQDDNNCRAFAAVITRMVLQCINVLSTRSTAAYLMNSVVRSLEQTSYRLLSLIPRLSPQFLAQFERICTKKSDIRMHLL
jgi:hypothetical protein